MTKLRTATWLATIVLSALLSLDFRATCDPLDPAAPATQPAAAAGSQPDVQTQITQAIGELSADSFKVREAATRRLAALGPPVVPAMQAAATDPDPEVSQRARTVLKLVRDKLIAELPPAQRTVIRNYFSADANGRRDALNKLICDSVPGGSDSDPVIAFLNIAEIDGDAALTEKILTAVVEAGNGDGTDSFAAQLVGALLMAGRVEQAEQFLNRPALRHNYDTWRTFVLFAFLRGRLDEAIRQEEELAAEDRDNKLLASLYFAKGDYPKAAAAASQADDEETIFQAACLAGDWKQAARSYEKQHGPFDVEPGANAVPPPPIGQEDVDGPVPNPGMQAGRQGKGLRAGGPAQAANADTDKLTELACSALLAQLAGNNGRADKALAEIKDYPADDPYKVSRALALLSRPADAIEAASKAPEGHGSFDYLVAQGRYQEAIDYAPASQPEGFQFEKVKLLRSLGELDKAKATLNELTNAAWVNSDLDGLGKVYVELYKCGFEKEAQALLDEAMKEETATAFIWIAMRANLEQRLNLFIQLINFENPNVTPGNKFRRLKAMLLDPTTPERFASLAAKAEREWATSQPNESNRNDPLQQSGQSGGSPTGDPAGIQGLFPDQGNTPNKAADPWDRYQVIANACEEAGFLDLATMHLDKAKAAAEAGGEEWAARVYSFLEQSGKLLLRQKRWLEAADKFGQAWKLFAKSDQPTSLALFYQGWALTMAGRKAEGEKLIQLAELLPLADGDERTKLANAMEACGLAKQAARQWEIMLRTADSFPTAASLDRAARAAIDAGDFNQAATYWQCARLAHFTGDDAGAEKPADYLQAAARPHIARALQLAAASRPDEALAEVDRAIQLLPLDTDSAILLVNALAKLGQTKLADAAFGKYAANIDKLLAKYPRSPELHNRAAWFEVRCHRRLDDALTHAEQAAKLDPQQPNNLDTLAEIYFQRGDRAKAVEVIERAIKLEPARDYFRAQADRFRTGDPKSPPPADVNAN